MKMLYDEFQAIDPGIQETFELTAEETVRKLSLKKALVVFEKNPDAVVVGADTIVEIDGEIVGKPASAQEAGAQLLKMSGRWHTVHTAVAVVSPHEIWQKHCAARVKFRKVSEDFLTFYAQKFSQGKAGSYGIQDLGSVLVESIVGDPYVVIGLPIGELWKYLSSKGWWNFETAGKNDEGWF